MVTTWVSAALAIATGILSAKCLRITPRTKNVQVMGLFMSILSLALALTTLVSLVVF